MEEKKEQQRPEVYLIADAHKLVVQSMVRSLKEAEIQVHIVPSDPQEVKFIPDGPVHVILPITDSIPIQTLQLLQHKVLKTGTHLFLTGKKQVFSIEEEALLRKIPAALFENYPIDIDQFLKMMEWNNRQPKRILVVDDEPMILKSIKSWLEADYEVYMVSSGMAALDFITKHPIDLMLLDYEMPGLTGPDVLNRIRFQNETKNLAVIFLTAKDDKESIMHALEQKPDGYMLKSRPPEQIRKEINDFFKRYVVRL